MINKKIHYIWLGKGEKSELIKRCIESWKKYLPDYEIKEWNEDNFDIDYNKFTRQSYDAKKYAFTSDVIRLYALYHEGGLYLDVDVMVYKTLDDFLDNPAFTGFEQWYYPVCATMGSEKGNPIIKEMLDYYKDRDFEEITNTEIMSNILEKHGIDRNKNEIQKIDNITIYPKEYFNDTNGYTKHWMKGSWKLKVSLIVPVYNGAEYIEKALNSIPKTDNIEVIIVNDGSTDNTKEICEKWKKGKKNVKLINLPENKGLGHAKNVGYDNAKGEYINQLDSDDYLYTEKYEQVLDQLDGTDIVYMNLEQNNGTILDVGSNPEYFCSGCARFIKREFLGDLRCPETRYAEDWHLTQELNKKQHTDKFTGIVAYHYNFPREGSLVDQAQKGLIQDTAPGRQKRIILWQSYFCPIGRSRNICVQLVFTT